ncbi:hypothetical protein ACA910_006359 [Epithemia clementina (nom. ined.)]
MMRSSPPSKVLVAGAGIIGLRTALEFCRRNVPVVLRAPHHPVKESCSVGAGGYWMPFHCEDPRIDRWAMETYAELHEYADKNIGDKKNKLVESIYAVVFHRQRPQTIPTWSTIDYRLEFQQMAAEMLTWQNHLHKLKIPPQAEIEKVGYKHAWLFRSMVVNTGPMLNHLLDELKTVHGADVNVETGTKYESLQHLRDSASDLNCDMVINCTGLGSRTLVPDPSLIPARGAILQFERDSCVWRSPITADGINTNDAVMSAFEKPWGSETHPAYLIPRGSTIVVGGTYLEGDEEPSVRVEERQQLLKNAENFGIDVQSSELKGEWVGFRPFRSPVRCEFHNDGNDSSSGNRIPIFHSYGYGGSGWTVDVGAAKECVNQVLGVEK